MRLSLLISLDTPKSFEYIPFSSKYSNNTIRRLNLKIGVKPPYDDFMHSAAPQEIVNTGHLAIVRLCSAFSAKLFHEIVC